MTKLEREAAQAMRIRHVCRIGTPNDRIIRCDCGEQLTDGIPGDGGTSWVPVASHLDGAYRRSGMMGYPGQRHRRIELC